jgi:hypothetical protein
VFERVGTVLWYTEQRTATSLTTEDPERRQEITEDTLRDRLSKWRQFHQDIERGRIRQLRPGQKDLYAEIERAYNPHSAPSTVTIGNYGEKKAEQE